MGQKPSDRNKKSGARPDICPCRVKYTGSSEVWAEAQTKTAESERGERREERQLSERGGADRLGDKSSNQWEKSERKHMV